MALPLDAVDDADLQDSVLEAYHQTAQKGAFLRTLNPAQLLALAQKAQEEFATESCNGRAETESTLQVCDGRGIFAHTYLITDSRFLVYHASARYAQLPGSPDGGCCNQYSRQATYCTIAGLGRPAIG